MATTFVEPSAKGVITKHVMWDNHVAINYKPDDTTFMPQLERYRAAGFDVILLNVGFGDQGIEQHIRVLGNMRRWLAANDDKYLLLRNVDDILAAKNSGRLAVGFDIEGGNAVGKQPSLVQLYYDLGVRWMLFAYNQNSPLGGGCQDDDQGLTDLGRAVIDEMNRVGMLVCLAHTGERTVRDIIGYAKAPLIYSHANPKGVHDHPRNVSDELLLACAKTGGVVCLNGIGIFLGENDSSTDNFVRHVDYLAELIGPQHIGFGSDYMFDRSEVEQYVRAHPDLYPPELGYADGIQFMPPEQMPEIAEALLKRGYSEQDVGGIFGDNLMRLARQVWQQPH